MRELHELKRFVPLEEFTNEIVRESGKIEFEEFWV
jgi:hypothetical protein